MKKRVFAAATAAMMTVSALGSVTAGAFEQMTLQTTRLAIVMKLADTVATGLSTLFSPISGTLQ